MNKIAILGNMNNNGMSLLRYFRDAGYDAYLFPYFNDGKGSLKHFKPDNDIGVDKDFFNFIIETQICNWPHQLMNTPFGKIYYYCYALVKSILKQDILLSYCTFSNIHATFKAYDFIITSGYGPAILKKANIKNYFFFPYTTGIEGIEASSAPSWYRFISRMGFEWARPQQIEALRHSKQNFIIDFLSQKNCIENKIQYKFLLIPLVYIPKKSQSERYLKSYDTINMLKGTSLKIFSFSRLIYTYESLKKYKTFSKNNDWIILSLKKCLDTLGFKPSVKIVMIEYGPDVLPFKKMLSILNLEDYFVWLPIISKEDIFSIIQNVDVCLGEFITTTKTTFGSAGWEVLGSGKPLVNGFNFLPNEFYRVFKIPEPPVIKISNEHDLEKFFLSAISGKFDFNTLGDSSKEWFDSYNSHALVKLWTKEFFC